MNEEPRNVVDRRDFLRRAVGAGTVTFLGLSAFGVVAGGAKADSYCDPPECLPPPPCTPPVAIGNTCENQPPDCCTA
jgi:hypothetical protein